MVFQQVKTKAGNWLYLFAHTSALLLSLLLLLACSHSLSPSPRCPSSIPPSLFSLNILVNFFSIIQKCWHIQVPHIETGGKGKKSTQLCKNPKLNLPRSKTCWSGLQICQVPSSSPRSPTEGCLLAVLLASAIPWMGRSKKKLGKCTSDTIMMKLLGCLWILPPGGVHRPLWSEEELE